MYNSSWFGYRGISTCGKTETRVLKFCNLHPWQPRKDKSDVIMGRRIFDSPSIKRCSWSINTVSYNVLY